MSRSAFPVCAGVLAVLGAALGVAIEPRIGHLWPAAPQQSPFVPRELPVAWRTPDDLPAAPRVLPEVSRAQQAAHEASPAPPEVEPKAATDLKVAAKSKVTIVPAEVKPAAPASRIGTAGRKATPFVFEGIEPLEPADTAPHVPGDLVRKSKTPFVTPEIAPAEPPVSPEPIEPPAKAVVEEAPTQAEEPQPVAQPKHVAEPEQMPTADYFEPSSEPLERSVPFAKIPPRTPEVMAAVNRASEKVPHGFELAERGALYSARAEFADGLKLVAQAYDAQQTDRSYVKALAAGLAALKESADFVRQSQSLQEVSIASIIVAHSTPVLKDADASNLTLMDAAQCYYTYAQEQLSAATAGEMVGSMALYGMGRVAVVVGRTSGQQLEQMGQSAALFRAALIAHPRNFRAANELGVQLAENGQLELARDLLIRSVSVAPQVTTWRNLAAVHKRIGQQNLAQRADAQASAMQVAGHGPKNEPAVEWVDPATFAATKPASDNQPPAVAPKSDAAGAKPAKTDAQPPSVAKKGFAEWLGLSPRR